VTITKLKTELQTLGHLVAGANNRSSAAETSWMTAPKPRAWIRWLIFK
jgi:hypothetical protein